MPRIEGKPGERLTEVWVYLSKQEAHDLLAALQYWAEEREGYRGPGWHAHIGEAPDPDLTIAVED
jgi:hypothetical protein